MARKIQSLSIQLAKMIREKNSNIKKRKLENTSTKQAINKGRKKLNKLLHKFKKDEKQKFYSSIEKTAPLARISKIIDNKNTELGVLTKNDGTITNNPEDTLHHLADELLGKEEETNHKQSIKQKTYINDKNKIQIKQFINESRLEQAIKELKKNKAAGSDNIFNEIIIASYDILKDKIIDLMRASIQYSYTPIIWRKNKSAILAKPEKELYSKSQSFRIITLSSNMLKLLEKLILWHLQDDLKIEESMNKYQYGFRKGSSTEAAILNLVDKIQEALKNDEHVLGIFLDIQGAFDNLPYHAIRKALNRTAAKGMICDWIMDKIENRHIELKSSGTTISRKIPKGCPQGGVLSPFLWNLVIDSLLKEFQKHENVQAFADDVCLLSIGKVRYGIETKAKNTMKQIIEWCKKIV